MCNRHGRCLLIALFLCTSVCANASILSQTYSSDQYEGVVVPAEDADLKLQSLPEDVHVIQSEVFKESLFGTDPLALQVGWVDNPNSLGYQTSIQSLFYDPPVILKSNLGHRFFSASSFSATLKQPFVMPVEEFDYSVSEKTDKLTFTAAPAVAAAFFIGCLLLVLLRSAKEDQSAEFEQLRKSTL
ncbi:hypothetical protein [Glaciecola sp. 1036]|uniref:hypothetical protein n=1 Tax=Alteromonadaceae TaxID=72275 RepID=UPI003CFE77B3